MFGKTRHLDFVSPASTEAGIHQTRGKIQLCRTGVVHGPRSNFVVQEGILPLLTLLLFPLKPLIVFIRLLFAVRRSLSRGNTDPVLPPTQRTCLVRLWRRGNLGLQLLTRRNLPYLPYGDVCSYTRYVCAYVCTYVTRYVNKQQQETKVPLGTEYGMGWLPVVVWTHAKAWQAGFTGF